MRFKKFLIFSLLLVFVLSFQVLAAVTCDPLSLVNSYQKGNQINSSIYCTNNGNISVTISKSGDYFEIDQSVIGPSPSSKTIKVIFDKDASMGTHTGSINFNDGTTPIPILFNVEEQEIQNYGIIVFPTSKVVNIQQGQVKNQNIQIIVPSNYPRIITIQSVSTNPDLDILHFGDLDLGLLQPGQTLNIPIVIDARDVQTGTYNTQISILATDSQGQVSLPTSNFQAVVSVGVSPTTNDTFSTRPSCSLSSTELNRNSTYSLTCQNVIDNLEVVPQYNEYLEGVRVEYSSGVFIYTFKATQIGNTKFVATFNYKGAPIFEPYSQNIKITPSGTSPVAGTTMRVNFYQRGEKTNEENLVAGEVTLLVLDNVTSSTIEDALIYLNGVEKDKNFTLGADKDYELIVSKIGYLSSIMNLTVKSTPITITLNPNKEFYRVNEQINITTDPEDAILTLNDVIIENLHTFIQEGTLSLKASKQGYLITEKNITLKNIASVDACTPIYDDWKKGTKVICDLDRSSEWEVYGNGELKESGNSTRLEFKIDEEGTWEIKSEKESVLIKSVEDKGILSWVWSMKWWILGIGGGLVVLYFIFIREGTEKESGLVFSPKTE